MTSPNIALEEQFADQRSRQVAYKLTISSSRNDKFQLIRVEPKIPSGSKLIEIIDTSIAEINNRRKEICVQLSSILNSVIWVTSKSFRDDWVNVQREAFREIFSVTAILRIYGEMLFPFLFKENTIRARVEKMQKRTAFEINSVADALTADDLWIKALPEDDNNRKLFNAKLEQLKDVEGKAGKVEDTGLADIDANCPFTATYVINFERNIFEPRKYQVGFDVDYKEADETSTRSTGVYQSLVISPSPISLSFVAVISALLGTLVKLLLSSNVKIMQIGSLLDTGSILVGPIVALVFFNIYEQTSIGRGMSLAVNWRSALAIGVLCGLAHERILEAMKALIGVQ